MKKVIICLSALLLTTSYVTVAQDTDNSTREDIKNGAKKTGRTIKKGAKKVGNKTAEYSVKGAAKVADRTYDGKTAPNGRTVYVTDDSRYYWIDKKGGRHFVQEHQLKDKTK
jgi:hypothetical protein